LLSIGFILLTHGNESQALRLVRTLGRVFGDPPIACHHDFSRTQFRIERFPRNVRFVQPHVRTQWGTISLVQAMLGGLRLLYDFGAPDWFYFLSGADYPICDADSIGNELARTPYDAYLRLKKVDHTRVPDRGAEDTGGIDSPSYLRLAYQRYIARSIPIPSLRHPHRGPAAMHLHLLNPGLLNRFHPFNDHYFCYAGDQWFAGNTKAAAVLLAPEHERLLRYLKGRFPPDEAFCPTVLGNSTELKISSESKHFIRWEPGNHPRLLEAPDMPEILRSNAHFARKFAPDAPVLNLLDNHLRAVASPGVA